MINNTHYNLIDTLVFAMGKEKLAALYDAWHGESAQQFSALFEELPLPVASILVDCFEWADDNHWKPWCWETQS